MNVEIEVERSREVGVAGDIEDEAVGQGVRDHPERDALVDHQAALCGAREEGFEPFPPLDLEPMDLCHEHLPVGRCRNLQCVGSGAMERAEEARRSAAVGYPGERLPHPAAADLLEVAEQREHRARGLPGRVSTVDRVALAQHTVWAAPGVCIACGVEVVERGRVGRVGLHRSDRAPAPMRVGENRRDLPRLSINAMVVELADDRRRHGVGESYAGGSARDRRLRRNRCADIRDQRARASAGIKHRADREARRSEGYQRRDGEAGGDPDRCDQLLPPPRDHQGDRHKQRHRCGVAHLIAHEHLASDEVVHEQHTSDE